MNRCELNCKTKDCGTGVDLDTFAEYRQRHWGNNPNAIERRLKVQNALTEARHNYLVLSSLESLESADYPDQFLFKIRGKAVCQKYYANVVGMTTPDGFKNKTWVEEVNIFMGRKDRKVNQKAPSTKGATLQAKREHAYAHIMTTVDSQVMDKSAHANYDKHLYLPYHTLTSFFDEYVYLCRRKGVLDHARRSTFATAMAQVVKDKKRIGVFIRMSGAKGIFPVLLVRLAILIISYMLLNRIV